MPSADAPSTAPGARDIWAIHVTARRALEVVVGGFGRRGIEVLAVKGVVTAHLLYADPAERLMGDVDVRIRPEDVRRAARVAADEGWQIAQWKPAYGAFVLFVEGLGVSVDVESVIGAPGLCGLSIAEMLSRSTRGIAGMDVRVPEIHDHAVLLAVNVFKDKLTRASPHAREDVRRIAEAKGFDVDRFVARAQEAKIAGIAWIVADWMVRENRSDAWGRIRAELGGESGPRPAYARAFRWLGEKAPAALTTRVLARVGADDPRMWLGAVLRAARLEWELRRK